MTGFVQQGEKLRARREELGQTFDDVYAAIHVPITYLRGLESGKAREMPPPAYARGFLKSYCQHLELDPEPFLYAFCDYHSQPPQPVIPRTYAAPVDNDRPPWLTEFVAWGAIVALILLSWVSYAVVFQPLMQPAEDRVEAGQEEAPARDFFPLEFPQSE
ncbi:MAG: helix-turn-helix domain-containing protein [Candidatus Hydrogenedentota bacterium]